MFSLTGKVALVTGASSGIGRASALALASQGAKVALAARRVEKLDALVAEIKAAGGDAIAIPTDVLQQEDVTNAVAKTVATFGRLDILLNNAGVGSIEQTLNMTGDGWDKVLDTNLKAYFFVAQAAAKEMIKNKFGRIINIASILSGGVGSGMAGAVNYCASKGGVVSLTEALADEFAQHGITVNAIGPGFIETEMTEAVKQMPDFYNTLIARIPMKRFGKAEEIAATVVYLASDEASYTTGATLYIDGGWTAS
ncbi:MAG: 3-oxoacyl-ACP reductase family protein [Microgenomates group bacterium]